VRTSPLSFFSAAGETRSTDGPNNTHSDSDCKQKWIRTQMRRPAAPRASLQTLLSSWPSPPLARNPPLGATTR
jgi:hypothetical protein